MSASIYKALNNAWLDWHNSPNEGDKYIDFDVMALEKYGIDLTYKGPLYSGVPATASSRIIDEKKYTAFLLRWL
jgi:hypothetical protein